MLLAGRGRRDPCPAPGGAGIFLRQQSRVSYCCLFPKFLLYFRAALLLCSAAWPGCECRSTCGISLSQGTPSFSPPSPFFLALHIAKDPENMACWIFFFFFFCQMHFALEEPPWHRVHHPDRSIAWSAALIWARTERTGTPSGTQPHPWAGCSRASRDHPMRIHSRDPKAPFPRDLRVPRSRRGLVVPRAQPHPWMGTSELAFLPLSWGAAGLQILAMGRGGHTSHPACPG